MRVMAPPPLGLDAGPGDPLILRDGSVATVRIAGPADGPALRQFFRALSPEARRQRFFCSGEPSDDVIERLCTSPDHAHGVTLLATRCAFGKELLLGAASYVLVNNRTAEAAFAVDGRYNGQGIATSLLERLAELAVGAGLERFQAVTFADNDAMLSVFRDSGFTIRSKSESGVVEVELSLTPSDATVAAVERRETATTVASIRPLLEPQSVAVVGASRDRASLGRRIFDALTARPFRGPVYAVNRAADDIGGAKAYRSARDLPAGVDLAVLAVPREAVLATIEDCAAARVKAVLVITAGFAEANAHGRDLQQQLVSNVRGYGMRMIGPNCLGLLNTRLALNASFSPIMPPEGSIALSSQSGALGIALLSLSSERSLGLSTFVSVGNKADVSGNDLLQYWEQDPATRVILLYLESFGNPRRFARLARRIGKSKPIVALKAGRTRAGSRAAGSHTAAMAASDVAVEGLFQQAGVIRADTIDEMFDIAACLDLQPLPAGRRIAIVTNAGGPGILAADACEAAGLTTVEFSESTRAKLRAFLPDVASVANPVDMVASAGPDEYRQAVTTALTAEECDALLVIYTPVDASCSARVVSSIRDAVRDARAAGATGKPVVACLMAEQGSPLPIEASGERIPAYAFPENAARALGKIAAYAEWRRAPAGLFWTFNDIRADEGRAVCRQALETRCDGWLQPEEVQRLLGAFGLGTLPAAIAHSADEAVALASVAGFPVAAKLTAHGLLHKSDIGGVCLNLDSPQAVRRAFDELATLRRTHGLAENDPAAGVLIQPMVAGGTELLVGLAEDPLFGPLVGVGLGGIHVEIAGDVHFRIAPLTDRDAGELIHSMRGFPLLAGARGRPPADLQALSEVVLRVSRLAEEIPEITELDLNPAIVLAAGKGYRIVDARVRVGRRTS